VWAGDEAGAAAALALVQEESVVDVLQLVDHDGKGGELHGGRQGAAAHSSTTSTNKNKKWLAVQPKHNSKEAAASLAVNGAQPHRRTVLKPRTTSRIGSGATAGMLLLCR
jgi:hypothetical protein